jgi:hypothetical protein
MKLFLACLLVMLAILSQAQTGAQQDPDLVVLKFSCGKYETGSGMIRSVQDPSSTANSPIHINPQPKKDEPQELKNQRDMFERRLEMRNAEINASLSRQKGSNLYFYRLQVKNSSPKIVKSFAWEYQPTATPDPLDRQFYCAIKAKPNESKELELFSPLAPSWVVDAAHAGDKKEKVSLATVIINQIEYTDGTVWKRKGWNPKTFSEEWVSKTEPGKCIGL